MKSVAKPLTLDGLTFAAETPLDVKHGFPFYRASYLYELVSGPRERRFYAPINYLSRGDVDVMGAFVDASVRVGHRLGPVGVSMSICSAAAGDRSRVSGFGRCKPSPSRGARNYN